jgi:hypothetical protein
MPTTCPAAVPATCRAPRRAPPLRRTDAGGAIGRDALDCRHDGERRQDLRPLLAVLRPQLPHRFQAEVLGMTS